jgi:hypothetical protein
VVVGGHADAAAPAGDASDQSEDFGCSVDACSPYMYLYCQHSEENDFLKKIPEHLKTI